MHNIFPIQKCPNCIDLIHYGSSRLLEKMLYLIPFFERKSSSPDFYAIFYDEESCIHFSKINRNINNTKSFFTILKFSSFFYIRFIRFLRIDYYTRMQVYILLQYYSLVYSFLCFFNIIHKTEVVVG